jgi:hypothetical protein
MRLSDTLVRTRLRGCGPPLSRKQKKFLLPRMPIRPAPKQRDRSFVCPLSHRPLLGCRAMPFPCHCPRRVPSLPTPLTYVPITCAAHLLPSHLRRSLSRCLSVAHHCRAGHRPRHCRWGARAMAPQVFPDQAKGTHERCRWWCSRVTTHRRMYVAIVTYGSYKSRSDVAHVAYFCKCFQLYVARVLKNISEICCSKCFMWMLHIFHTYVSSILSECYICFTHMLQLYF